jgi:hypothetical protein
VNIGIKNKCCQLKLFGAMNHLCARDITFWILENVFMAAYTEDRYFI